MLFLILLFVLLLAVLPTWPYSSGWGYYPSGGLGLVLLVVLVLFLSGRIENGPNRAAVLRASNLETLISLRKGCPSEGRLASA